jgi:uncharacterized protein YciI
MPHYIYLIHPLRHEFFEQPTEAEEAAMAAHFDYLKQATEAGTVLLAGPCLDETFGLVVFQAADEETARAFIYHDPSVQANVMMAELHPFHLSLMGGK